MGRTVLLYGVCPLRLRIHTLINKKITLPEWVELFFGGGCGMQLLRICPACRPLRILAVPDCAPSTYKTVHRTVLLYGVCPLRLRIHTLINKKITLPEWVELFFGGGCGIRTHVGLPPNGFQDRLVMTTSITLRAKIYYHNQISLST